MSISGARNLVIGMVICLVAVCGVRPAPVGAEPLAGIDETTAAVAGPTVDVGQGMTSVVPARILDTRDGTGAPAGRLGPARTLPLVVTGRGGLPATGVGTVVLNVTVTGPTAASHLALWPAGATNPGTSNLNFDVGQTVPNLVTVKVGRAGVVNVYNHSGETHVIADVMGWFPDTGAVNPVVPARILDTRDGTGAPAGRLGPARTLPLVVTGRGGLPATGVGTVVLNVTVTGPTAASHLALWPAGAPNPGTSNLNFSTGQTVPNLVIVKVGAGGVVNVYNHSGETHVIADVMAWFPDTGAVNPVVPARILDTRDGTGAPAGRLGPARTLPLVVTGRGGLPATGVGTVVLNVTVTGPTAASHLALWPAGAPNPGTSNLNFSTGQTVPNLVVVKVGAGGVVNVFNQSGETHVIADVMAWFPALPPDQSRKVQPFADTVLLGSGDVVSTTGDPTIGGTATLARSADVPSVGGQFFAFPSPSTPLGLMGNVTGVAAGPNGTTVVTFGPTTADDVLADDEASYVGPVTIPGPAATPPGRAAPQTDPAGQQSPQGLLDAVNFFEKFSPDSCGGAGGGVSRSDMTLQFDNPVARETHSFSDRYLQLEIGMDVTYAFTVETTATASCTFEVTTPSWPIGTTGLFASLSFSVGVAVTGAVSADYSVTAPVRVGFEAGDVPENTSDTPFTGAGEFTGASGAISVTATAGLSITYAKVVGVTGSLELKAKLGIDTTEDPCITLTLGPTVSLAATLDLWLKEWEVNLASYEPEPIRIWSAHPSPPCPDRATRWEGTVSVTGYSLIQSSFDREETTYSYTTTVDGISHDANGWYTGPGATTTASYDSKTYFSCSASEPMQLLSTASGGEVGSEGVLVQLFGNDPSDPGYFDPEPGETATLMTSAHLFVDVTYYGCGGPVSQSQAGFLATYCPDDGITRICTPPPVYSNGSRTPVQVQVTADPTGNRVTGSTTLTETYLPPFKDGAISIIVTWDLRRVPER